MNHISFIPKRLKNDPYPWLTFGCNTEEEYEKWIPEICGICCLKMIGDTFGKTNHINLYNLTMKCFNKGGFKILANGDIMGVFHYPLLETAKEFGLNGEVRRSIDNQLIINSVNNIRFVILSIDLSKVKNDLSGSHLVLVHNYNRENDAFLLHDTSCVLDSCGENIPIPRSRLEIMSNHKGLILWNEC